jgi:signal transduction histidine kinase
LDEKSGLGLGLAIVKKILEVHDINIFVESSENTGTVFSFSLPKYKGKSVSDKKLEYS